MKTFCSLWYRLKTNNNKQTNKTNKQKTNRVDISHKNYRSLQRGGQTTNKQTKPANKKPTVLTFLTKMTDLEEQWKVEFCWSAGSLMVIDHWTSGDFEPFS